MPIPRSSRASACVVLLIALCACEQGRSDAAQVDREAGAADFAATDREVKASLAGAGAAGAQTYAYRGMYAGMTQAAVEEFLSQRPAPDSLCHPAPANNGSRICSYDARLGADSAHLSVEVLYSARGTGSDAVAQSITSIRDLPLDVDGVRLAHMLADAFEKQTTLLDKRDASYGHQRAQVRMGTLNGAQQNYADVTVEPHGGRERLTVKLTRTVKR